MATKFWQNDSPLKKNVQKDCLLCRHLFLLGIRKICGRSCKSWLPPWKYERLQICIWQLNEKLFLDNLVTLSLKTIKHFHYGKLTENRLTLQFVWQHPNTLIHPFNLKGFFCVFPQRTSTTNTWRQAPQKCSLLFIKTFLSWKAVGLHQSHICCL